MFIQINRPAILVKKNYYIYVLELDDSCFYVGITSRHNPMHRIEEHFSGNGAKWSKLHKPIRLLSLIYLGLISEDEAEVIEENTTLKYMKAHGYNHVRGGTLSYSGNYVKYGSKFIQTKVLVSHWA